MFFKRLKMRRQWEPVARSLYGVMVERARLPFFYQHRGVPDTLEGRFDLLALHMALLVRRLENTELIQVLVDLMFADMDVNLRNWGVSDIAVGRKVRKLAEGFYGRLKAYEDCLDRQDRQAMIDALGRNLYGRVADEDLAGPMADYAFSLAKNLALIPTPSLLVGVLTLEEP
jgi:cytochrome b pre-mRNA-processing protein 3